MKKGTLYITQTALMLALLLVFQFVTLSFGQIVTGSLVNLMLLVSVFIIGISGGLTIAIVSPFFAFLLGIAPMPTILIVPFIAIGNTIFVCIAWLIRKHISGYNFKEVFISASVLIVAAILKFLFLWIGLVTISLPLMGLIDAKVNKLSIMFTWPQLITALIGSMLAIAVVPLLKKAITSGDR